MIIDGKKIAEEILNRLKDKKTKKFFAAFLVGENPASVSFLKQKEKIARSLDIDFRVFKFEEQITQDKLRKEILKIANHKTCGGVIVQLPLPAHINAQYVMNVIPREKDVDVLGERALGAFYAERNFISPPAVGVVEEILKNQNINLNEKKVAVVGLGALVGKPIATWLKGKVSDLYLLDKGSDYSLLKNADIVILGTGQPHLISKMMLKEKVLVIDFGYGMKDGKICGDFNPNESNVDFTPTPGGTGPILVVKLLENFFLLVEK
ncbi:MAG: bifunctional 5,10-methylenetetrahydrofolate dehydrogenase/5,10-methenyltetrahydrofolate cyclohydrolase [Patescibacteria group bacterium]